MNDFDLGTNKPAFEDTMLIDTIRAMRRDRKDHVKNLQKTKAQEYSTKENLDSEFTGDKNQ